MKPRAPISVRTIAAEGLIGLALCAGAYFLLVDPVRARVESLRAAASPLTETGPAEESTQIAAMLESIRREVLALAARPALPDEATLTSTMMKEAAAAGVRVDSIRPALPRARPTKPAPPAMDTAGQPISAPPPPADRVIGYAMDVSGEYDAIRRFVRTLPSLGGYTVVKTVRMSPDHTPGSRLVQAVIETEHVSMDLQSLAWMLPTKTAAAESPR